MFAFGLSNRVRAPSLNRKPQTANRKPQTANRKPQTANRKPQIANCTALATVCRAQGGTWDVKIADEMATDAT
jgi:hypothetical protein